MVLQHKELFYHEDSGEIIGAIARDSTSWLAQTIFGYTLVRTNSREEAERVLIERGRSSLRGIWQYFDDEDKDWFPCVIQEATEKKVVLARTNERGMQDSATYKHVVLMDPTEENLMKLS